MKSKEEVLQNCIVIGNVVKLPNVQLDRKIYQDVAKSIEYIGGKWKGGKVFGFVFPHDPSELLIQIANGENRNLKKEFQFFATPSDLADTLCEYAFQNCDIQGKVLEPSAGQGAIINSIHKIEFEQLTVRYCELNEINRSILKNISHTEYLCDDFLKLEAKEEFATIIANPPFSKNQDIDHIYKMYECLKPKGRIVTICSKHFQFCNNKKETEFLNFLNKIDAEIIEIPANTFKDSGTSISALIIIINKK